MSTDPRAFLTELFNTAVAAGHPYQVLADHLPEDRSGRAIVIGAGKAAGEKEDHPVALVQAADQFQHATGDAL
ncbi:hypothetical protein ACV35E_32660, partial [Pseudomonas aeruginosa]